jgi:predicted Zn-ribbon and HTH transcriptional regulator
MKQEGVKVSEGKKEVEVGEVLRRNLPEYLEKHKISAHQRQVLESIKDCRTHRMGYHLSECDECGYQEWMYNSCRDRHCPKCQWIDQQEWVDERMEELPRVGYHHVVSTLPDLLHNLMLLNKALIYHMAFRAVAETIQTFGRDDKHLGAEIGIVAVLHTWGQTLNYHVHIHCLVTGGGLTKGGEWKEGKYGEKFLFPVRAMSQVFRGKFIAKLRKAYEEKKLKMEGKIAWMANPAKFEAYIGKLASQMFRIHSKPATKKPESVIRYLGAYMRRGPISDRRIMGIENGQVCFRYKDYRNSGVEKVCRMAAEEFIRRYLCHVLPKCFVRVRYYGIFAGAKRKTNLAILRKLVGTIMEADEEMAEKKEYHLRCPKCYSGRLVFVRLMDEWEVLGMMMEVPRQLSIVET